MQFMTKKDYAYEQIKNDILSGKFRPGDKLVIRDLAKQYGMSYIPIREAISQLFYEGLVHSVPYTGTRVAEVDVGKIFETTVLRYQVEDLCLRTAIPHITPEDIQSLSNLLDELDGLYQSGNLKQFMIINRSFYSYFYEKSPYLHIKNYAKELFKAGRINTSLIAPEQIAESLSSHRELVRLVAENDVEGAVRCHHAQKRDAILAVFGVIRNAFLHPQLLENSPVSAFYLKENVEANQQALLEQLEQMENLFLSY